ncbi:MAG: ABC transporter substrate-binding protein [Hylemonella sp.]
MKKHSFLYLHSVLVIAALFGWALPSAAAQDKAPVYLGLDAEFGHLTSTSPLAIKMGILTAMEEINSAGGVLGGRPLQLIERDNRSIPARGVDNLKDLAAQADLVAVFVGKFTPVVLEQAPVANALKIPLLDPWAAADDIISTKPANTFTFRLSLRDSWAVPAMLSHLKSKGKKRVGVMLPSTAWGRSNEKLLQAHGKTKQLPEVVGIQWYNFGATTLNPQWLSLKREKADSLLFVGNEGEGSLLVRELSELPDAERVPVVSHWGVTGGNFLKLVGASLDRVDFSVVQTFTFEGRSDPKTQSVVRLASQLFKLNSDKDIPSHVGFAHAYDLTHILALALGIAGSTDRQAVRSALEKVRDYAGLIQNYKNPFSPTNHEALSARHVFIGRFTSAGTIARP